MKTKLPPDTFSNVFLSISSSANSSRFQVVVNIGADSDHELLKDASNKAKTQQDAR